MTSRVTATKETSAKTKSKAPAVSAGAINLGAPFDPFSSSDPFGDDKPSIERSVGKTADKIHIRLQQRNGRKTITTVAGIPDKYDPRKLLKAMKKEFACNGHVVHSADSDEEDSPAPGKKDEHGKVLQFQGDQRASVKQFLVQSGLLTEKEAKDQIVIHGY
ncbi:suppressor of initiator codon mutation [Trichosporon asahii var. asahii CBS 2479]|uniref:Suppressor of initiator codon mutation n=1 Tax=Trichosporon asahii var. asahii (strain ATCC 90039 / CBS 2479 / JCM 2466 / KCTC 7840 / NBRC 103889/ NCYC 2677 / UAMH 7654) TaxID=1186058 RepID=J5QDA4_TRIAS|nr:suppressor of initiator codon mutation [Trichosporon asahii var. asahii CBS 2479]EJT46773.1 suppressor of initiator codon mutation [Trichosporon asahii var. asahii CBS 2479]